MSNKIPPSAIVARTSNVKLPGPSPRLVVDLVVQDFCREAFMDRQDTADRDLRLRPHKQRSADVVERTKTQGPLDGAGCMYPPPIAKVDVELMPGLCLTKIVSLFVLNLESPLSHRMSWTYHIGFWCRPEWSLFTGTNCEPNVGVEEITTLSTSAHSTPHMFVPSVSSTPLRVFIPNSSAGLGSVLAQVVAVVELVLVIPDTHLAYDPFGTNRDMSKEYFNTLWRQRMPVEVLRWTGELTTNPRPLCELTAQFRLAVAAFGVIGGGHDRHNVPEIKAHTTHDPTDIAAEEVARRVAENQNGMSRGNKGGLQVDWTLDGRRGPGEDRVRTETMDV
ncbi:hypothetical protein H4582DRAFT_2063357 [Lactarius indigo]|nr:hypothetical protein H4582DRAFT_2063357 [Lactarius indigo]